MKPRTPPVPRDWLALGVYAFLLVSLSAIEAAVHGIDILPRIGLKTGTELVVLCSLCALPLLVVMSFNRPHEWRWILLGILVLGCDWSVQSSFPLLGPFRQYYWNWQGYLLATAGIVAFIAASKSLTFEEIGVTSRLKPRWWLHLVLYATLMVLVWIVYHGCRRPLWDPQTFWFQATMPGLHEELLIRGFLLAILVRAFETDRQTGWRKFGLPAVATSLYFGLVHVVHVSEPIEVTLLWGRMYTALLGLVLWWIRVGTGSLWPAVIVHNLINLQLMATYDSW